MLKTLGLLLSLFYVSQADDVVQLTDANFDSNIAQYGIALVKFYAPWCGHCKRMAPDFDKAASILKSNDPPVTLIKVDCTVETKTCGQFNVRGYPTLKIFKSGVVFSDYKGPREVDGIVKFMIRKAGPASTELNSVQDVEKFLDNEEHSIICFYKNSNPIITEFKKVAEQLSDNHRFAHSNNPEVLAQYKHEDKIVIYQPPRLQVTTLPNEVVFSRLVSGINIVKFIKDEIHGLVGHRTRTNYQDFRNPLIVVMYNVDYAKDIEGTNHVRNKIIEVAQKLKDEGLNLRFAISNLNEFAKELEDFGIKKPNIDDKLVIGRGPNNQKYKLNEEFSPESFEQFARDLVANKLEAFVKSEPIPESNPDAVKTVVAKNFDQIVNDETKDVLIEFYAPWCGHCKSLAPKYEELAKTLKDESDIIIAKMDATANDIQPQYEVRG